jgi:hypothetical protein
MIGDDVIVFTREASVWAASFDAATGTVSEPAPVLSEVGVNTIGTPQMVVSSDGMLVHAPASHAAGTVAFWVDRQGKEEPLNLPPGLYVNPIIAPDGLRAAIGMWGSFAGQPDALWLVQHGGSSRTLISRAGI